MFWHIQFFLKNFYYTNFNNLICDLICDFARIQYFRDSIMFIHESRLKGEGCLVHWWVKINHKIL